MYNLTRTAAIAVVIAQCVVAGPVAADVIDAEIGDTLDPFGTVCTLVFQPSDLTGCWVGFVHHVIAAIVCVIAGHGSFKRMSNGHIFSGGNARIGGRTPGQQRR